MLKIASNGGIGNRLRTMIGYASVYHRLGKSLPVFIWKDTQHAPPNEGAFRIAGTEIIDVQEIDHETVMVPGTIDVSLMHRTYDLPNPDRQTFLNAYGMICFSEEVKDRCICTFDIGIHIRMTDMRNEDRLNKIQNWMHEHCHGKSVYLACDEPATFERLKPYFNITNYSTFINMKNSLRRTSIKDAAIDMLSCINAKCFVGTGISSFSHMIENIRLFRGKSGETILMK